MFYEQIDENEIEEYSESSNEFVQNWNMAKAYFNKPITIMKLVKTSMKLVQKNVISEENIGIAEEILTTLEKPSNSSVPSLVATEQLYSYLSALINYYNVLNKREPVIFEEASERRSISEKIESLSKKSISKSKNSENHLSNPRGSIDKKSIFSKSGSKPKKRERTKQDSIDLTHMDQIDERQSKVRSQDDLDSVSQVHVEVSPAEIDILSRKKSVGTPISSTINIEGDSLQSTQKDHKDHKDATNTEKQEIESKSRRQPLTSQSDLLELVTAKDEQDDQDGNELIEHISDLDQETDMNAITSPLNEGSGNGAQYQQHEDQHSGEEDIFRQGQHTLSTEEIRQLGGDSLSDEKQHSDLEDDGLHFSDEVAVVHQVDKKADVSGIKHSDDGTENNKINLSKEKDATIESAITEENLQHRTLESNPPIIKEIINDPFENSSIGVNQKINDSTSKVVDKKKTKKPIVTDKVEKKSKEGNKAEKNPSMQKPKDEKKQNTRKPKGNLTVEVDRKPKIDAPKQPRKPGIPSVNKSPKNKEEQSRDKKPTTGVSRSLRNAEKAEKIEKEAPKSKPPIPKMNRRPKPKNPPKVLVPLDIDTNEKPARKSRRDSRDSNKFGSKESKPLTNLTNEATGVDLERQLPKNSNNDMDQRSQRVAESKTESTGRRREIEEDKPNKSTNKLLQKDKGDEKVEKAKSNSRVRRVEGDQANKLSSSNSQKRKSNLPKIPKKGTKPPPLFGKPNKPKASEKSTKNNVVKKEHDTVQEVELKESPILEVDPHIIEEQTISNSPEKFEQHEDAKVEDQAPEASNTITINTNESINHTIEEANPKEINPEPSHDQRDDTSNKVTDLKFEESQIIKEVVEQRQPSPDDKNEASAKKEIKKSHKRKQSSSRRLNQTKPLFSIDTGKSRSKKSKQHKAIKPSTNMRLREIANKPNTNLGSRFRKSSSSSMIKSMNEINHSMEQRRERVSSRMNSTIKSVEKIKAEEIMLRSKMDPNLESPRKSKDASRKSSRNLEALIPTHLKFALTNPFKYNYESSLHRINTDYKSFRTYRAGAAVRGVSRFDQIMNINPSTKIVGKSIVKQFFTDSETLANFANKRSEILSDDIKQLEKEKKEISELRKREKSLLLKLEQVEKDEIKRQKEEQERKALNDQWKDVSYKLNTQGPSISLGSKTEEGGRASKGSGV